MSNKEIQFRALYLQEGDETSQIVHFYINPSIQNFIREYFELNLGGKNIVAPYFINLKRRKDLRSLVGKGLPGEMVLEAKVWAQVKGFDLNTKSAAEVREFMQNIGIGIDCSGLVVHALNLYLKKFQGYSLLSRLKFENKSFRARLARIFRPIENISANELTSTLNCETISVHDVRPGDLIRGVGKQRNAYHVGIVTQVDGTLTEKKDIVVTKIHYVHSHRKYGKENGMRMGTVDIVDSKGDFLKQRWNDFDANGVNHLYESDLAVLPDESGFRRLKFFIT